MALRHLAAPAALLVVGGCAGLPAALTALGSAGSVYTAVDKVTEVASPFIKTACSEYFAGKAAADAIPAPASIAAKLTSIESYGDAACANPPAGDPLSTAIWLGTLVGEIKTLTAK